MPGVLSRLLPFPDGVRISYLRYLSPLPLSSFLLLPPSSSFFSLFFKACETSRIQGGPDLYSIGQNRIIPTFELMAGYTSQKMPTPFPMCKTPAGAASLQPTWDVMYNHYHNRLGLAIPNVTAVYNILHAAGYTGPYEQNLQMGWEQLTHSGVGNL